MTWIGVDVDGGEDEGEFRDAATITYPHIGLSAFINDLEKAFALFWNRKSSERVWYFLHSFVVEYLSGRRASHQPIGAEL